MERYDILISPAAPSAAYKIGMLQSARKYDPPSLVYLGLIAQFFLAGEKINDPLAMYAGDIMTVFDTLLSFVDFTFLFALCSKVPADMEFSAI